MTRNARQQSAGPHGRTVEQLVAVPVCVGEIRTRCRARAVALGATEDTLDAIAIAVSEAASNAVLHAYAGISDGQIEFEMSAFDQQLEIVIRDGGAGIGYAQSPGGLGQGLLIIDELADTFRVTSAKGTGTTVTMRFQLP